MKLVKWLVVVIASAVLFGCASWVTQRNLNQSGSAVDYLYPNATQAPQMEATVTYLRPPVRVGIAFAPGGYWNSGLAEADKLKLLDRVKASFSKYDYIGSIEVIPSQYLRAKGGFTNLEQVARMFNVEVMVLLSYDQVQFNDTNSLSFLYWTIVGAYVIHGDQYDVQTMLDASVFDVATHKLLFRAPGTSQVKGGASMAGFTEKSREARLEGYNKAADELIPNLQAQLGQFKERLKTDTTVRVENKAGYHGGGDFGLLGLLMAMLFAWIGYAKRERQ